MMMKLGKGYQWSAKLTIISLPYLPLERLVLVSNSANNKRSLAMVSRNRRNVKCATCATPSFMELLLAAVCKTWKCDRGKNMRLTKGQFSPRPLQCCRGEKCPELCLNNRRSRSPPPPRQTDKKLSENEQGLPFSYWHKLVQNQVPVHASIWSTSIWGAICIGRGREGVVSWRGSPSLTGDTEYSMFREIHIRSRLMTSGPRIGWKTFVKRAHKVKTKVFRNKEYLFGKTCAGWGQ